MVTAFDGRGLGGVVPGFVPVDYRRWVDRDAREVECHQKAWSKQSLAEGCWSSSSGLEEDLDRTVLLSQS